MRRKILAQKVKPSPEVAKPDVMTEEVWKRIGYWSERRNTYDVVGTRVPRIDAKSKVMGTARYVDDIFLPRMLYGKILRSPGRPSP